MESNFIVLELQKSKGDALIKPGEITSMSPTQDDGARVVTRQKQVYYVVESVMNVDIIIRDYFRKIRGE